MEKVEQAESKVEEKPIDLAAEARAEWEASKEPEEKESEPSDQKPDEKESEPKEDVVEEKPEEVKPEAEAKEEPKAEDRPVEEKKEESPEDEKFIQDWALKHGMTTAEAREDLDKTRSVVKKYQSPEEMARALRQMQSQYDKMKNETSKVEEEYKISANPRIEVFEYVRQNSNDLVEKYRQNYPAKSRDMEDDAILEEVAEKLLVGYENFNQQQIKKLNTEATKRRDELLSSLNENDRRFLPDVKAVLDKTNDRAVMSKNFSMQDVLWWAKGQQFDKVVKDAEERGYKRAKEEAKILGVVPSSRAESTPSPKKGGVRLSEYEKKLAREMFATTTFSDEEKYEAYIEVSKKGKRK